MSRLVFHGSGGGAPLSSREITKKATDYEYTDKVPLTSWLRTASTILREADVYYKEGNEEQAFLLYMRHMDLIVSHLPAHPEAKVPRYEKMLVEMNTKFPAIASRMEKLKSDINTRYEAYYREKQKRKEYEEQQQALMRQHRRSRGSSISSNGSTYGYGQAADARSSYFPDQGRARPGELEKMGRRLSMQTSHSSSTSPSLHPAFTPKEHFEEHGWSYEPAIPTPTESNKRMSFKKPQDEEFDLQRRLQELQLRTQTPIPLALQPGPPKDKEKERPKAQRPLSMPVQQKDPSARMEYPSIPKRTPYTPVQTQMPNLEDFALPSKLEQYRSQIGGMPIVPPKIKDEYDPSYTAPKMMAPSIPTKERFAPPQAPSASHRQSSSSSSGTGKEKHYANHVFDCVAYTEGGNPLRTIFISQGLRAEFLKIAAPNTRRNLETCGILCGFLRNNAFFVNRLVIPEQEATSDTCGMTDEAGLFNYVEGEDLMVLGWIHTHPTQTCFMSSVDLHTHCPYQMMLPESIAIVCAPKSSPSWGVFRLTDPRGIGAIKNCTNRGLFHPHSEPEVYTDALRPGHVCEVKDLGFGVVDLRS